MQAINESFDRVNIKEIEPTTQNINETTFEEDLSIMVDELVNIIFNEVNEGKGAVIRKQHLFNYINDHKVNSQEIYKWLLNNQTDSNSIYLLGYFNHHGIGISVNKEAAFELYQKAGCKSNVAQYDLTNMDIDGEGVEKDHNKAFELSKILAEKKYPSGI